MEFTISTSDKRFFRFNLSEEWFKKDFDYKKVTGILIEDVQYHDSDDNFDGQSILELSNQDYSLKNFRVVYEQDEYDKYIKIFCNIKFKISDRKISSLRKKFKNILKIKDLLIFTNLDHPLETGFIKLLYKDKIQPEESVDYYYISPAEQAIMNGETEEIGVKENDFNKPNKILENITNKILTNTLNYLVSEYKQNNKKRFLEYTVQSTGDNKLVVGDKATTWISLSNEQENKLTYFLEDEEGVFELEHFDVTIIGLKECLTCLFYQQDEVSKDMFERNIINLHKN